jgi:hypothetical protein
LTSAPSLHNRDSKAILDESLATCLGKAAAQIASGQERIDKSAVLEAESDRLIHLSRAIIESQAAQRRKPRTPGPTITNAF